MTREFPHLRLRPAKLSDAQMLLLWRNDPLTRSNSRMQGAISQEEHQVWLTGVLASKGSLFYIAEDDGHPVGCVRAQKGELTTELTWELSWTIAPNARGKGYGKAMVVKFVRELLANVPVTACIEEGNIASESIAKALGLSLQGPETPNNSRPFMIWR